MSLSQISWSSLKRTKCLTNVIKQQQQQDMGTKLNGTLKRSVDTKKMCKNAIIAVRPYIKQYRTKQNNTRLQEVVLHNVDGLLMYTCR